MGAGGEAEGVVAGSIVETGSGTRDVGAAAVVGGGAAAVVTGAASEVLRPSTDVGAAGRLVDSVAAVVVGKAGSAEVVRATARGVVVDAMAFDGVSATTKTLDKIFLVVAVIETCLGASSRGGRNAEAARGRTARANLSESVDYLRPPCWPPTQAEHQKEHEEAIHAGQDSGNSFSRVCSDCPLQEAAARLVL